MLIFLVWMGRANAECDVKVRSVNRYLFEVVAEAGAKVQFSLDGTSFALERSRRILAKRDFPVGKRTLAWTADPESVRLHVLRASATLQTKRAEFDQVEAELADVEAELARLEPAKTRAHLEDVARQAEEQARAKAERADEIDRYRANHGGLVPEQVELADSCTTEIQIVGYAKDYQGEDVPVEQEVRSAGCDELDFAEMSGRWGRMVPEAYEVHVPVRDSPDVVAWQAAAARRLVLAARHDTLLQSISLLDDASEAARWACDGQMDLTSVVTADGAGYTPHLTFDAGLALVSPLTESTWDDLGPVSLNFGLQFPLGREHILGASRTVLQPIFDLAYVSTLTSLPAGTVSSVEWAEGSDVVDPTYSGEVVYVLNSMPVGVGARLYAYPRLWVDVTGGLAVLVGEPRLGSEPDWAGADGRVEIALTQDSPSFAQRVLNPYGSARVALAFPTRRAPARFQGIYLGLRYRVAARPDLGGTGSLSRSDGSTVALPDGVSHVASGELGLGF